MTITRLLPRNQVEIARSNATVGRISLLFGDRINAERHLSEANELLNKIHNRLIEGRIKPDMAFLQHRIERFAYLLEYYRAEELKMPEKHRISEEDITQTKKAMGLVEEAISTLEKKPVIKKELADAYYVLGELYMVTPGKEHWQKAEEAFENALKWGKESQFLYRVADTLESLVTLYYFWNGESDMTPESKEQNSQKKKKYQDELEQIDLSVYPELAGKFKITLGDEQFDIALELLHKKDSGLLDEAIQSLNKAFDKYVEATQCMKGFNDDRHYVALRVFYNRLKTLADEELVGKILPIRGHLESLRPLWKEETKELNRIYTAVMIRLLPENEQKQRLSEIREQVRKEIAQWNVGLASILSACLLEVYRLLTPKGNENDEYLEQFLLQLILQADYYRIINDEYQADRMITIAKKELEYIRNSHLKKAIDGYIDCREGTLQYRRGEYGRFLEIFLQDDLDIGQLRFDRTFPEARKQAFNLLQSGERKLRETLGYWENMLENADDEMQKQSLLSLIKRYRQYLGETRFRFGELLMLNKQFEDDTDKKQKGALSYLKMAIEDTRAIEDWYRYDDCIQSYVNALYFSDLYNDNRYSQEYRDYIDELENGQRYPSVMGKLRIMQGDVLFSQYFQREDESESGYHYVVKEEQKEKSEEQRKEIIRRIWGYYVEACNFTAQHGAVTFAAAVSILQRRIQLIQDAEALEMTRQGLQSLWERQAHLKKRQEELYTLVQFSEIRRLILAQ